MIDQYVFLGVLFASSVINSVFISFFRHNRSLSDSSRSSIRKSSELKKSKDSEIVAAKSTKKNSEKEEYINILTQKVNDAIFESDYSSVEMLYDELLQLEPESVEHHLNMAKIYRKWGLILKSTSKIYQGMSLLENALDLTINPDLIIAELNRLQLAIQRIK